MTASSCELARYDNTVRRKLAAIPGQFERTGVLFSPNVLPVRFVGLNRSKHVSERSLQLFSVKPFLIFHVRALFFLSIV